MADQLLKELGIADGVTLQLNTLGDAESREAWRAALVDYFEFHRGELSEDSQKRLSINPLRILDSKDARDRAFVGGAPKIDEFLSGEAQNFFGAVTAGLDAAGVKYERAESLVRGLDYYRHTAFEFVTDRLGAQGTVLGGGRYDGLMEALGGPHTPAVGWAAGIERLAMLVGERVEAELHVAIVWEGKGDASLHYAHAVLAQYRRSGISAELIATGSSKKRFDRASKMEPVFVVIVSDYLLENGMFGRVRVRPRDYGEAKVSIKEIHPVEYAMRGLARTIPLEESTSGWDGELWSI